MPDTQTAQEIHQRLSQPDRALELHREALKAGMPLSRYLEVIDPSEKGSTLDAFGRQLREAGIITRSNPMAGWWASEATRFFDDPVGRALYPEFFARQWRSVMFAPPQQRAAAILLSSDYPIDSPERPYPDVAAPEWLNQFQPAIPLNELVGSTQAIQGEDYRSIYMTYDADALRLFRIGESAEIPTATLTTSSRANRLRKYGRGLRATYEQLRRMRIDRLAWWIRWQALQSEVDKVTAALDYLVSGDGNSGTAATVYDLTDLDSAATAGTLTLKGWLNFRMQFNQPYTMTTALMPTDVALQVILLNAGTANVPLAGLNLNGVGNSLTPINTTADGIRYGWTAEAPASKIIGFDRRFALEQVTEIGSEIRETERFITNQTELMVMTETSGFGVMDASGTKILNLAA
jgi:hypothetical protein